MTYELALHGASALLCAGLAAAVVWRDRRSFVHQAFGIGMAVLAAEAALTALGAGVRSPAERLGAERLRLLATALLPWAWLRFSLAFGRSDYRELLRRWRPVVWASLLLPLGLVVLIGRQVLTGAVQAAPGRWRFGLGGAGYLFQLAFLSGAVLILANLERTLRASTGSMRWFIKYMVLGVGGLFAARIYTSSQALLFRSVDPDLHVMDSAVLLVAAALMAASLLRSRLRAADVYVSQSVLYSSMTALLVGIYLLTVGVLAKAVVLFGGVQALPLVTFVVFLGLIGLVGLLLSDRLRGAVHGFVTRNFRRPHYDYRKEWTAFTRATTTLIDTRAVCSAVAARVSETLRVPSVTVWLLEEGEPGGVVLGGSTIYSDAEAASWLGRHGPGLVELLRERLGPLDLHELAAGEATRLPWPAGTRYALALTAAGEELGFMVLGGRPGEPLTVEDLDLLKTLSDQAAGSILGLRLLARVLKAKEMEAFQSLSAFFVHDLKNLASKLSLTLQNLPAHYEDPEFRRDLLATIQRSVAKIDDMCARLSPLSRTLELQRTSGDLSQTVGAVLAGLNGSLKGEVAQELRPTRPVAMDPEQIQKVVLNLVLNANDAVRDGGHIRVETGETDRWVYFSVSDDGCGMSRAFMARSLFKPFQTTKDHGLGIGLFHSKSIVEAHRGRIEVDSEPGKGTTFRVLLPVAGPEQPARS
ncbi:MAG: PEP-CTERM system histidine kinase PrsK [Acidobacteria bacterium]|nr:MAG: PEP-CTERM system histidine kinase PrsK [Acidobacteriota bacterium]